MTHGTLETLSSGMKTSNIALAPLLSSCPSVITLGIRACLGDYSEDERRLLMNARRIFFPGIRFVDVFQAIEKNTFPSPASYKYPRSRLLQEALCQYLKLPHPRRRIYFGTRQKQGITRDFSFPFILMSSRPRVDSIHLIRDEGMLRKHLYRYNPILVEECETWEERIRMVFVNFRPAGVLRSSGKGCSSTFLEFVPLNDAMVKTPLDISCRFLPMTQLDDILLEWGLGKEGWKLISITRPPVRWRTATGMLDRRSHICSLIQSGVL